MALFASHSGPYVLLDLTKCQYNHIKLDLLISSCILAVEALFSPGSRSCYDLRRAGLNNHQSSSAHYCRRSSMTPAMYKVSSEYGLSSPSCPLTPGATVNRPVGVQTQGRNLVK